jgi:hypothetical protein
MFRVLRTQVRNDSDDGFVRDESDEESESNVESEK